MEEQKKETQEQDNRTFRQKVEDTNFELDRDPMSILRLTGDLKEGDE